MADDDNQVEEGTEVPEAPEAEAAAAAGPEVITAKKEEGEAAAPAAGVLSGRRLCLQQKLDGPRRRPGRPNGHQCA